MLGLLDRATKLTCPQGEKREYLDLSVRLIMIASDLKLLRVAG